jgi:hypothetical protein
MPIAHKAAKVVAPKLPKMISPTAHAVIDYAVFGAFFAAGALLWKKNKRASLAAYLCADIVGSLAFLTDMPGGVWKKISFETHGRIDPGLSALAASVPEMLAFKDEREAKLFQGMGIAMAVVGGLTDYDQGSKNKETRLRDLRSKVA